MGGSSSKQTQNVSEFLSKVTTKSITTNQTSCQSTATVNQSIVINNDPYAEATKCNQVCATASAPAPCYAVCQMLATGAASSSLDISDINQTAQVTLTASCTVNDSTTNAVKQDVTNAITQAMDNTSDDLGSALKGMVSSISKSSDSTVNKTTVESLVENTFTTTNLQTFVNTVAASQTALFNIGVTNARFNNITQMASTQAMTQMLATNETLNTASQAVTNSVAQSLVQKSEILPGIQDGIRSLLGGIGSLFSSPLLIVGAVIVVVLIAVVLLM